MEHQGKEVLRMLQTSTEFRELREGLTSEITNPIDLEQLLAIVRRQWRVVAGFALAALLVGGLFLLTATPRFTSTAGILIDESNQKIVDQMSAISGVLEDEGQVLSQVELLKSEKIALAVSKNLDLENNDLFVNGKPGMLGGAIQAVRSVIDPRVWFGSEPPAATETQIQRAIVEQLLAGLGVTRVGRSYVLEISYTSPDPALAASIAKAYAEAYLADQLDSKYEATKRAGGWLQDRIAELRQRSLETDRAVQKFRAEKGLIATDGQLITDQQLAQLNTQLIAARAESANAEAKYNRIKSILDTGDLDAAVTESIESDVISELRTKFLDASRKQADIASRLGAKHVQAARLRSAMAEYKRLMFEELSRIAQSYQSTNQVALSRQKSIETQVSAAMGVSATANDAQVQLRELERESETYKNLYQTFLQRYQESIQQQSFPVTEARIITNPAVAEKPSSPKKPLVLAVACLAGMLLGAGVAGLREFRDRFYRTGDQVSESLGLEFLGSVPLANATPLATPNVFDLPPQSVVKANSVSSYVLEHPLSAFAETLRSAKMAIDVSTPGGKGKVVGIVSALPGEGKSSISVNLAELLAQGSRVLLIDADLRNPGATRQLGRHAERGILEALQEGAPLSELLLFDPETGMAFLPAVIRRRIPHSAELLTSGAMARLLTLAVSEFDYVILDLPPIVPVVDSRAVAALVDSYLLVVEWGKTARGLVKRTMQHNPTIAKRCAGVILNKVDAQKMKLYRQFGSSEFYHARYASYYRE
jgi:succinoglycan biosynthesis transport protein ExoP